ncbi:unnamed protein product [Caretta caretta]
MESPEPGPPHGPWQLGSDAGYGCCYEHSSRGSGGEDGARGLGAPPAAAPGALVLLLRGRARRRPPPRAQPERRGRRRRRLRLRLGRVRHVAALLHGRRGQRGRRAGQQRERRQRLLPGGQRAARAEAAALGGRRAGPLRGGAGAGSRGGALALPRGQEELEALHRLRLAAPRAGLPRPGGRRRPRPRPRPAGLRARRSLRGGCEQRRVLPGLLAANG